MGLRLRAEEVPAGADVPVEIAIRNTGEKPIELHQHRFNIYDYYSRTQFAVSDNKGRRTLLAKPVWGVMKQTGKPWLRSLKRGEVYIHTVRLNRWPVAGSDRQNARNPLCTPGIYTIECTYTDPPYTPRPLALTIAPVKVVIVASENSVVESCKEAAKTGNEGGLSARIILPDVIKPVDGAFPARLRLTNNGKQPVRVATLCQAWRSSSKGAFHVSLQPDRWKSDRPTVAQSVKSAVVLSPGESTTLPFEIVDGGGETLHVTASYGVLEEFAKKVNAWFGFLQPARVVLKRTEESELRILPSDQLPLPGTQVSIEWVVRQPQAFAAVCEAVSDARAFSDRAAAEGVTGEWQVFKVAEVLVGNTAAADDATFEYYVLDRPGAHERAIRKGERIIWIARPRTDGESGVEGRLHCLKALPETPENRDAVKSLAAQSVGWTSPPPSRDEEADILDYAAKHPRNVAVQETDGTSRRPQYGDVRLERAEEALKNYAKPWTVKKVLSWYKEAKDGKTRAHLLRVLAASRHPRAAIELGEALDDKSWDVRLATTEGLADYFLAEEFIEGGSEEQAEAVRKWWQEKAASTLTQAEADRAARLVKSLKANKAGFVLSVEYRAPQADINSPERGDHRLTFTVAPPPEPTVVGQYIQITEAQADRIIDHLAVEQLFLGR
ncbi:MAG TPA: HEAT repeat domain-containing protein, partial [Phycisphaerae bacterium]|nr:HEAT repeat domain-containing protein [Phycisphaerae bacterium]